MSTEVWLQSQPKSLDEVFSKYECSKDNQSPHLNSDLEACQLRLTRNTRTLGTGTRYTSPRVKFGNSN
jgi:hypothetical protein